MDYITSVIQQDRKRQLRELLIEQKRRRGKKDLHFFCKKILGYTDLTDADGFHGKYCRHLENEKYKSKLTLTPRGTLKSSIGTIGHSLQDVIKNPNVRILLASEKFTNSTKFLSEIKGHIENNEEFIRLYGELKGKTKWTESEIIVNTRTTWKKESTISCAGIDVTKVGMHYDIIRVDDPHSDQNTGNQDQIDKVIRWYKLLLSLLDPGGYIYITGTIWHFNDLYNYILNKERERAEAGYKKKFKVFKRDSFKGTLDDLQNGDIPEKKFLWPQRLSAEFLRDQLLEQGPYIFSCQYRLNPVDDETATFKRSWIQARDISEIPKHLSVFSTVDPMRDEEGKDYLAVVTVGMDKAWNAYILDCVRTKADEHETVDQLFAVYDKWKPKKIGFETVAWQKSYYKYVKMLQIMRGIRLPMVELKTDTKVTKRMRIKGMVPYWKAGYFTVVAPKGDLNRLKGGMAVMIDELTRFPKTANDDTIDALSYVNQLTHRPTILKIMRQVSPKSFNALRAKVISKKKRQGKLGTVNVRRRYAQGNVN